MAIVWVWVPRLVQVVPLVLVHQVIVPPDSLIRHQAWVAAE
jgi:hypothetical protein